jgi:glutamate N-acetyltransferase/amino-acid N-acetyltransferase
MSTNDSVFVLASGAAGNGLIEGEDSPSARTFAGALNRVTAALAEKIVRDGEGATKFVKILVQGARDAGEAKELAFAVANSPLFKTAMYGEDPNWGRIASALGAAGVAFESDRVEMRLQGHTVFSDGEPRSVDEEALARLLRCEDICVEIVLQRGDAGVTVLTSDFSPAYVDLNST